MSSEDELFTLTEVLDGFSAKRARLLLFQIENRTAYLMTQARRTVSRYLTEEVAEQQDLEFFEALAEGREPPVQATIRDLERYAPQWQSLVPSNLSLQATLARLLGQKYSFAQRNIPHIRKVLALDSEGVQRAFEREYRQPFDTIYSRQPGLFNWVRWRWNKLSGWIENLSPFWTVYSLIFAEMVGASVLALPIALAGVGPLAGVVVLVVMGAFNVLTIAAMAEAVTRNGSMRYQGSYLGRVVQDYLGRTGSMLLTAILFIDCCLLLLVYYLGISLTLAEATPVPAGVWAGVIFLSGIYFVRKKTLDATVTSALVVGAINLGLILILSILALRHLRVEHLLYVHIPFLNGSPFEPVLLGLIFGIVLSAYDGHLSVSSCARTMLRRDPGGRSLIWAAIAAEVSAMAVYILWVVAVNGAFAPQALIGLSETVVTPLAQLLGPVAIISGTMLALLAMGIGSIFISLAIFFMVQEWIPGRTRHTLALGRRQGKVTFTPRDKSSIGLTLTYLGLKRTQEVPQTSRPQFRIDLQMEGGTRRFEVEVHDTWEATTTMAGFLPKVPSNRIQLTLKVVTASADIVRVQLITTMRMRYEGILDRLGFDLLEEMTDDTDMTLIGWLTGRERANVEEVAHFLDQSEQESRTVLNELVERGVLLENSEQGGTWYQVHFAARRKRQATRAVWQALDDSGEVTSRKHDTIRMAKKGILLRGTKELMQGNYSRFWLGLIPLILIFLTTEWLLLKKLESFSQLLDFLGIVALPVEIGVFPALLLYASRRKGEYVPSFVLRFLAHPAIVGIIYLVSVGILFLHGLFIWQNILQRAIAVLVGVIILVVTYMMIRQGAFARRLVIELRQAPAKEGGDTFTVTDSGRAATEVRVRLGYAELEHVYQIASGSIPQFPDLRSAKFHLSGIKARELRVWLHRVTSEGQSENLPALVKVFCGTEMREFHMDGVSKEFVLPLGEVGAKASKGRPGETGQLEVEVQLVANRG
jgi:amino acid permease